MNRNNVWVDGVKYTGPSGCGRSLWFEFSGKRTRRLPLSQVRHYEPFNSELQSILVAPELAQELVAAGLIEAE